MRFSICRHAKVPFNGLSLYASRLKVKSALRQIFSVSIAALFVAVLVQPSQSVFAQDATGGEQVNTFQTLLPLVIDDVNLDAQEVAAAAAAGFHVRNGNLLDANGNKFVMRGINYPYAWYHASRNVAKDFKNIKATKANTVRVVLSSGQAVSGGKRWDRTTGKEVKRIVDLCKQNKLICVLELHDTTGWKDKDQREKKSSLVEAANYWKAVKWALVGQEKYVLINIGNEPIGNPRNGAKQTKNLWVGQTKKAITAMRKAGFKHSLIVDAPNWGQDWQHVMRDNAKSVFNADPQKNVVFSVHMYQVYNYQGSALNYIQAFTQSKMPLIIGEFAHKHGNGGHLNVVYGEIVRVAKNKGIGYIAWSWSGNTQNATTQLGYLDITKNFNPNKLTAWGKMIINGKNGIKQTSKQASVYR